jgi:transglutaminase-like putative cysteine protease
MVRIELDIELNYEISEPGADFIFNIHAAHTNNQTVIAERLGINQRCAPQIYSAPTTRNRYMRLHAAPGPLQVTYQATVDIRHHVEEPADLKEVPVRYLPLGTVQYIYPSRYCQSDEFIQFATQTFGHLPQGFHRVRAVQTWVQTHLQFKSNTSTSNTSAIETFRQGSGVCRDFAHLMIALLRAINIPARFTTGTDFGADPAVGPPDFHAYVEVYLGDRWYIFDSSGTAIPMGFVRFGTGRDAADVAFATIFGDVTSSSPVIRIKAVEDEARGLTLPFIGGLALSTDGYQTND